MNRAILTVAVFAFPAFLFAQDKATAPEDAPKSFPGPDFVLIDKDLKPRKGGVVLGPMESTKEGGTKGSFAIYGGSSWIQVGSLSFSGDGKILAVGSTPGRVDLWDVVNQKKLRTMTGGTTVALSADGRLLAKEGKGIELCDVATGKVVRTIPRTLKTSQTGAQNTITNFEFNPAGTLLDVAANGEEDVVYDVSSGQLLATLTNTQHARFSQDGALSIGGNSKHLIVWRTKDWSKVSDLPNGPDYVTRIAAFPQKDLVVVGGAKGARLLRLSSGEELAKVGLGYVNFAEFNQDGTLIFTYTGSGFAVWNTSGKQYCSRKDVGNGSVALSADGRWLTGAPVNGKTTVMVWNVQRALGMCGIQASPEGQ